MKKLFILESNYQANPYVDLLKNKPGLTVIHATNLIDAVYYLEYLDEESIESYDYFLFEIFCPSDTVQSVDGSTLNFSHPNGLNGLTFFDKYREKISKTNAKIGFITTYVDYIKKIDKYKTIPVIDKFDDGFLLNINLFLS